MFPEAADHDIRVLATDIDRHVLGTARRGVYQEQQIEALPAGFRQSFLEPQPGSGPGRNFGVVPKVKDLVAFRELNLLGPWPMSGQFQAIFCRNVVIYFDRETQARLWSRFSDALTADGHLFLGHSERVEPDGHHDLRAVGTTLYQKVDPASAGPERN